jgi:hypothetical protein
MKVSFAKWGLCFRNVFSRMLSHCEISISVDVCEALPLSVRSNVAVECVLGVLFVFRILRGQIATHWKAALSETFVVFVSSPGDMVIPQ